MTDEWESVDDHSTWRLRVPDGWLYRHKSDVGETMAFVPDFARAHQSQIEAARVMQISAVEAEVAARAVDPKTWEDR